MPYQGQARWRRTGWLLRQWACLAFMLLAGTIHGADATWKAGVAKAVITPGQPLWMAGYGGRTAPAEGKYHDLWVRALALEAADGHRSVILSSDILGISQPIYRDVTAKLKERFQLEPSQVMLHASHTHCGPVLRRALPDIYPLDDEQRRRIEEYSDRLTATIVDTIGEALEDLQPASLSSGIGSAGFAVNRRTNREPDVPMLRSQNLLLGPVDHSVPVLAVRRGEALTAVVFGYACHNTTLAFQKWCGDYAGFAQDELEAKHPGLTAMFALGCGADQNPLPRRTVELAKDYGHQLSLAVEQVLAGQMTEIRPTLRTELQMTDLSYGPMPPQDRLEQMAAVTSMT